MERKDYYRSRADYQDAIVPQRWLKRTELVITDPVELEAVRAAFRIARSELEKRNIVSGIPVVHGPSFGVDTFERLLEQFDHPTEVDVDAPEAARQ